MRMPELKALTRERGYSKLRKAELIAFLQSNERRLPQQPQQPQQPAPSGGALGAPQQPQQQQKPQTKRQHKCRRAKDTKSAKRFVSLNSEINALKLQREELKEKISHASRSAHSGFKRKKIKTMKRDADKISARIAESEARLESMRVPNDPVSVT